MVKSASATRSAPATLIEKVLPAATLPVYALPLTTRVTVSPTFASPPTVPVIATVPAASAALMTSSAVMLEVSAMVGTDIRSTLYVSVSAPEPMLPAASDELTEASTVKSASAARSAPDTLIENVLPAATSPV